MLCGINRDVHGTLDWLLGIHRLHVGRQVTTMAQLLRARVLFRALLLLQMDMRVLPLAVQVLPAIIHISLLKVCSTYAVSVQPIIILVSRLLILG